MPLPTLIARALNLAGKPFGVAPVARAFQPGTVIGDDARRRTFDLIYADNAWGSAESRSGVGSEQRYAAGYRLRLERCLAQRGLRRVFDAPCGDLNWMLPLVFSGAIDYVGGDIVGDLVAEIRRRQPGLDVREFDLCSDTFPSADVWHCRDCLFHLSFADIGAALDRFVTSDIPWALITTHRARWLKNVDVATGGWRYLDLERAPFGFPPAETYLRDYRYGRDFPRYVGLWSRRSIESAIR